ncbi:hypothetical protein ACU6ZO_05840 [Klebsiella aerogenes]|uniref:hypothetical protein n=2 Tax=Klebsiella aerogenes TaxID=548 RepID=UPI0007B3614A|nr:hypothetical protein [Klebsiella aerogenes]MEC5623865.1 hypothetical protein [Klebsiella aerogenes]
MKAIAVICLLYLFLFSHDSFSETITPDMDMLQQYRAYSLTKCIKDNYTKMGVDFSSLPLKDHTMGLIFEMDPQGILGTNERYFEKYIEDKTKFFYQPKQSSGDLAQSNLVIYDCLSFSQSKELEEFILVLMAESAYRKAYPKK